MVNSGVTPKGDFFVATSMVPPNFPQPRSPGPKKNLWLKSLSSFIPFIRFPRKSSHESSRDCRDTPSHGRFLLHPLGRTDFEGAEEPRNSEELMGKNMGEKHGKNHGGF